mmetsp:Transcript_1028/g.1606  ORF Transcript_1028/g.1606 Transcript_1028/m.1606 type:complete len:207 (+) Transcript_1028:582-1202(+)
MKITTIMEYGIATKTQNAQGPSTAPRMRLMVYANSKTSTQRRKTITVVRTLRSFFALYTTSSHNRVVCNKVIIPKKATKNKQLSRAVSSSRCTFFVETNLLRVICKSGDNATAKSNACHTNPNVAARAAKYMLTAVEPKYAPLGRYLRISKTLLKAIDNTPTYNRIIIPVHTMAKMFHFPKPPHSSPSHPQFFRQPHDPVSSTGPW